MELLVHISAPITKKDDDRYKAEALAYLDFKPAVVHKGRSEPAKAAEQLYAPICGCASKPDFPGNSQRHSCTQDSEVVQVNSSRRPPVKSAPSHDMAMAGGQQILPRSPLFSTPLQKLEAIHNNWKNRQESRSTQRMNPRPTSSDTQLITDTQFAMEALESQVYSTSFDSASIAISSPLQGRASKRRRVSQDRQSAQYSNSIPLVGGSCISQTSLSEALKAKNSTVPRTPDRGDPISSQLPDSYGLSKSDDTESIHTPTTSKRAPHTPSVGDSVASDERRRSPTAKVFLVESRSSSQTTRVPLRQVDNNTSVGRSNSFPSTLPSKLSCRGTSHSFSGPEITNTSKTATVILPTPADHAVIIRNSSAELPKETLALPNLNQKDYPEPSELEDDPQEFLTELRTMPYRIYSPDPPTGELPIENATFVSEVLEDMVKYSPLAKHYHLRHHKSRIISKTERGHWAIDTTTWCFADQLKFWRELNQFVGGGKAGMATWCARDSPPNSGQPLRSLGNVRVWCYGEIVMHVYLFLFTLSGGKLKKQMVRWYDADGDVIVQIPLERTAE